MSDENTIPAALSITSDFPVKGIYYIGQYGTSGYASAAKGYLYHYFTHNIPITWDPLYFDDSKISDDNIYDVVAKSLIDKPLPQYDMVMLHSTPDLWPEFWRTRANILKNRIVNGYCTWETNRLPMEWIKCINNYVNEVWCPSTYNEQTFKDSGVTRPIRVVPHVFLPHKLPNKENVVLNDMRTGNKIVADNKYTFYSIGELNIRKGFEDTIKAFCESFSSTDPVRLILKVHYKNYIKENKEKCADIINEVLKSFPNHPPVICLMDNMSNKEILGLHSLGDCYVSLTKSEGFGLTIFDAYNYGKKIIATGYGGHIDFLGKDHPGLIHFEIGPVSGMASFSSNYTSEQLWAYPSLEHAGELMKLAIQ